MSNSKTCDPERPVERRVKALGRDAETPVTTSAAVPPCAHPPHTYTHAQARGWIWGESIFAVINPSVAVRGDPGEHWTHGPHIKSADKEKQKVFVVNLTKKAFPAPLLWTTPKPITYHSLKPISLMPTRNLITFRIFNGFINLLDWFYCVRDAPIIFLWHCLLSHLH